MGFAAIRMQRAEMPTCWSKQPAKGTYLIQPPMDAQHTRREELEQFKPQPHAWLEVFFYDFC